MMSEEHISARFTWAREVIRLTDTQWLHTVFSDEKQFTQGPHGKRAKVWEVKNAPFDFSRMTPSLVRNLNPKLN